MNIKSIVGTVIEIILKIVILAFLIMFIFEWITKAYDFGYKVFADEPVSVNNGRTITVSVSESATIENIADMLQEKGLIEDASLFRVQELLSAYHGEIKPGIYDLGTNMTAAEMLKIMAAGDGTEVSPKSMASKDSDTAPVESNIEEENYDDIPFDEMNELNENIEEQGATQE